MTRTSQFDLGSGPDPDPASHWDTKRKPFGLAEAYALLNAVLVVCVLILCAIIYSSIALRGITIFDVLPSKTR